MATAPTRAPENLPPTDPARLEAEVHQAVEMFHDGRPAEAVRLLRSVRRRAERLEPEPAALAVVARTLLSESAPLFDTSGDLTGALALLDRAEELAVRIGSAALQATVRGQRALVVLRSGDTRAALAAFDDAAALIDAAPDRDRAIVMLNRGVLHLEHADLTRAAADLARSVAFAEDADDARLASMARHNLGYVDFLAGRIPRALAAFEEAARTCPGGPVPAMQIDHARALREAGLVRDADSILARAAAEMRRERLFQDLGETELVRAECALADDDARDARVFAVSARRRFARRGNLRWQRKAELLVLRCERAAIDAFESFDTGDARRAAAAGVPRRALLGVAGRAAELAAACRAESRLELARSAELLATECRLRAGGPVPAEGPGPLPVPRLRPLDPLATRLQVHEVRALHALRAGDRGTAMAEVRHGLAELGSYQSGLGSLDLRTAGARHGVALAQLGLGIAVRDGSPGRVLGTVERSRAISTRLPLVSPPSDEVTARLLGELRQTEEEARALEGDAGADARVTALRSRAAALQRDIRARAWEIEADGTAAPEAPRLSEVRTAVRAGGTVFVSYARHQRDWLAVVVRPSGARLVPLAPIATVADLVRRVRADLDALAMPHLPVPLTAAVRQSLDSGLRRLDDLLVTPLGVPGRSLALSCSGPLAVLPWSLLPSRTGLPTVVTPAAATWLAATGVRRPARPAVVALAGPGLHESVAEAREVSGTWPGSLLLEGAEAGTAAARAALAEADLLHIAAHGTHRAESPLFSSLRLADGPLYAYELDAAAGAPGCVTLSACEVGLATPRPGDEGLGLTHVLLHLGVRSVLAGVARVRDDVAASTMTRLHRAMAAGAGSAAALAQAQQEADPQEPPAPFVCFGAQW
ncbi:CHAT domain-containing protein [Nocardioides mesophilus]|uniref:CHAT domain-containing protein n=1 Tax=Nocardioides mesophilus TaxID=433659 RepID=A0A7G9RFQ1_9ACTN|nr:CHAT domain-containing protein [Nocardioides mesophilus]QNN54426.1 CHAT domain-containing protein [Nocardioides mesophilus]